MKSKLGIILLVAIVGLLVLVVFRLPGNPVNVFSGAGELVATVASSSEFAVGGSVTQIFSQGVCSSRTITTHGSIITLAFEELKGRSTEQLISSTTLDGNTGFIQLASTTVEYDSIRHGCGNWYAFSADGVTTSNVSVVQFR